MRTAPEQTGGNRLHTSPHSYPISTQTQTLGLSFSSFHTTLWPRALSPLSSGLPACNPVLSTGARVLSLLPHQLSAVTHFGTQGKHSPVCRASSSPPPHLLTETRLLLFLTLQLPLAWGSPLYPHPLAPTRWHQSVILRALLQPEGPGGRSGCPGRAGLWGKQNKSVTAQSSNSPTPTLSEPVPPSLPYSSLPSIQRVAEGEPDFWVEGYCRKKDGIQLRREQS